MNINFIRNLGTALTPESVLPPIGMSAVCYLVPRVLDQLFPPSIPASMSYSLLRIKVRFAFDRFSSRKPEIAYLLRVIVRDNLPASVLALSVITQINSNGLHSSLKNDGRIILVALASCSLLHLCRLFITTVTCIPPCFVGN